MQNSLWEIGRGLWDCAELVMGCLGEGPKEGKGGVGIRVGWGGGSVGKQRRGVGRGRWCVQAASPDASPTQPLLGHSSLPYLLIKSFFFPSVISLCIPCVSAASASNWRRDPQVLVPATGETNI